MSANKVEVKVGQVWADNDKREAGRTVEVLGLVPRPGHGGLRVHHSDPLKYARCKVLTPRMATYPRSRPKVGHTVWIRLDRFRPTANGYRLVSDAPATDRGQTGE